MSGFAATAPARPGSRRAPAPSGVPEALVGRDHQPVRNPGQRAGAAADRRRDPERVTPFEFGLLGTIEFLPFILLSLPAGVWVDRLRRRPILIVGDLGRALRWPLDPDRVRAQCLTIWQLYVVGFVNGCLTVFFDVAYQSYLPSLVDRDDILEGNSKLEISRSGAQIAGPGIAGQLIGIVTAPIAILLDSLSYFASRHCLVFCIRKQEPPPRRTRSRGRRQGPGHAS